MSSTYKATAYRTPPVGKPYPYAYKETPRQSEVDTFVDHYLAQGCSVRVEEVRSVTQKSLTNS